MSALYLLSVRLASPLTGSDASCPSTSLSPHTPHCRTARAAPTSPIRASSVCTGSTRQATARMSERLGRPICHARYRRPRAVSVH
eukprot:5871293-Prymnesium_polylepis.1